ncbi:MAG: adenine phosphoribosyltransferase [Gammaproteobacteria bacterium]
MNDGGDLAAFVRAVPDFPKPGIVFRDITPLLADAAAFGRAASTLANFAPPDADVVAGMEARGFIFGAAVARELALPFAPLRKPGKLPRKTASASYRLEYGEDSVHIHTDAFAAGARVFLVDDLIATGGTLRACAEVIETLGARVAAAACLIELPSLGGRAHYARPLHSVLRY